MVNSPFALKRRFPFVVDMENYCPGKVNYVYTSILSVLEKRIKDLAEKFEVSAKIERPKVCMRCVNGEPGHITHYLEPLPEGYNMDNN